MVEREKIVELFDNDVFRKYSILFYQKYRTMMDVSETAEVARSTINNHLKKQAEVTDKSGHYHPDWIRATGGGREVPLRFEHKWLAAYLKSWINLSLHESERIENLLNLNTVDKVVRNSNSWEEAKSKTVTLIWTVKKLFGEKADPIWSKAPKNIVVETFESLATSFGIEPQDTDGLIEELRNFKISNKLYKKFTDIIILPP
ncbi:hypothetical protein AKJ38_03430 [candidate division MSBL1 archaeon SCGC-AAA259I14]|uniref:Uncharacterized protein n=1 Tax=candidate division MSBL1 archaeon SCGC-AAA259I14 TaxID=1698268 RepID=A0A133UQ74_9EURY|nr:hypothetical protein AKJ38_03430 [candidate division MSBL1 archaeon SCGC-AAA259I14]